MYSCVRNKLKGNNKFPQNKGGLVRIITWLVYLSIRVPVPVPLEQLGHLLLEVGDAVREAQVVAAESVLGAARILGLLPQRVQLGSQGAHLDMQQNK